MPPFIVLYLPTVLVYLGVDVLACWGLNLQYGVTGIYNLGFILWQAVGAYTAALLTLGPSSSGGGFQTYFGGTHLPFPLPILAGGVAAAILAYFLGQVVLRRLGGDIEAIVFLVATVTATLIAENALGFLNGPAGLSLIPQPLTSIAAGGTGGYNWFYVIIVLAACLLAYFFAVRPITGSPIGRVLRAIRDDSVTAASLGRNVASYRLYVFVVGGFLGGASGALLASFITTWSPSAWMFVESFVLLTAIVVGGTGNDAGVVVGCLLVPVLFEEITRYIPTFGYASQAAALEWVVIGALALLFLWFRPQGIIPERRRRLSRLSGRLSVSQPRQVPGDSGQAPA